MVRRPGRYAGGPTWLRYAGLGFEFAAAVGGLALVGYWIDRHFDSSPWGILIGLVLGLVGGLYNFIQDALQAVESIQPSAAQADNTAHADDNAAQADDHAAP